ncbi:cysteine-rich receptor-like protein kinase 44 [Euphorbia lathyris]|uniref:cysteine-rich receptor-like protein kinase 44 n=1 Tax=Euphorbia lathyris TaxID=212925 RepID=UPI003313CE22
MAKMNSISQIILSIHLLIRLASGQSFLECNNTANFTSDSTYSYNLNRLLYLIVRNTGNATGLFFSTSIGQGSDQVYGHSFCQADFAGQRCNEVMNDLIGAITSRCPNQKEAIAVGIYGIRYANRPINGIVELEPTRDPADLQDLDLDTTTQFYKIWNGLMEEVAEKASRKTVIKFATGEANYSSSDSDDRKIYVLMQCLPDLSATNCSYCLRQVVSYYRSKFDGKAGGYVQKPSCWFRWEFNPFYQITTGVAPPPPQLSPPPSPVRIVKDSRNGGITFKVVVITVVAIFFLLVVTLIYILYRRKKTSNYQPSQDFYEDTKFLQFDIETLRIATNNFSIHNKLGEGGFGTVYKGRLSNGENIAVKRWSKTSTQGEVEFENEVVLLAKLQHRNLVRFFGYCFQESERLLVYEFVPNQSLDSYIFDSQRRVELDWNKRYKIIEGITRGILYLHQDSQLQIIHRDLKPSNILLDEKMNPKISDFGTAKLFAVDQSQISTRRIVGTYGYMPPEYAIYGQISTKSDVFSFGVLVLEILSGQKVSDFGNAQANDNNLLSYAWRNWKEGTPLNVIDKILMRSGSRHEMVRCIHIGLLCVQKDLGRRPSMASINLMLSSHSVTLPVPSKPAYLMTATDLKEELIMKEQSVNEVSVSDLSAR